MSWPLTSSSISRAAEQLSRDQRIRTIAAQWADARLNAESRLNFDQERRLLTEEMSLRRKGDHPQAHLVVGIEISPVATRDTVSQAMGEIIRRHPYLDSSFVASSDEHGPDRERMLGEAVSSGVSVSGFHRRHRSNGALAVAPCEIASSRSTFLGDPELVQHLVREASKPFSIAKPPLLRTTLVEGPDGRKVLGVAADALVADWRSIAHIAAEVTGRDCDWITASRPRAGVRRKSVASGYKCLAYWTDKWRTMRPLQYADLPFALPRSDLFDVSMGWTARSMSLTASAGLRRFAASVGVAVDLVTMTATILALQHATQRSSVCIATEFRQDDVAAEDGVGPYSTTHFVDVDTSTLGGGLGDAVGAVARAWREAGAHSAVHLDGVWRALTKCGQLYGGFVTFNHVSFDQLSASVIRAVPMLDTGGRASLQIMSADDGREVTVVSAYRRTCFPEQSVEKLLGDLFEVLHMMASGPAHARLGHTLGRRSGVEDCYLCARRAIAVPAPGHGRANA